MATLLLHVDFVPIVVHAPNGIDRRIANTVLVIHRVVGLYVDVCNRRFINNDALNFCSRNNSYARKESVCGVCGNV